MDLLALAVAMKAEQGNSGLYVKTPRDIQRVFGCSYRKAQRLIEQAKNCPNLFVYNPKTKFLCSRTFKRGCRYIHNEKYDKRLYYDNCIKIKREDILDKNGKISHIAIVRLIRQEMAMKALRARCPQMRYTSRNTRLATMIPLTQQHIGNVVGYTQPTISRLLRKWEKAGKIAIERQPISFVNDLRHNDVIKNYHGKKTFIFDGFECVREPNVYTILDVDAFSHCRNVIYNHPKRITDNVRSFAFAQFD